MKIPSKTFCSLAWDHQFIDPTGRVKPCCRFAESARPKENNLNTTTLSNIFYGEWMGNIRKQMLSGDRVEGCIRCYQEEDSGKKSLRERYHDNKDLPIDNLVNLKEPAIKWIELAISNDCNLACRMCDSRYAWKWFKEEKIVYNGFTFNQVEHSKSDISNIFPFIKDLVHIKFTGGEPLITPDHWLVLDKLIQERDCSEIFLNYSTNCTIMPKEDWIEKWNKFKKVEFALSYDSCNPAESEYIRWPAKYSTTEKVTKRFLELKTQYNFDVFLRSTISILNVWHMPETLMWWHEHDPSDVKTMNPTHLTFPDILCVTVLPKHLKNKVADKFATFIKTCSIHSINKNLEYIINFMMSKDDSHLLPKLSDYLVKTDEYRKQDFAVSYPEFKELKVRKL